MSNRSQKAMEVERAAIERMRVKIMGELNKGGEKAARKLIELIDDDDPHVARLASRDLLTWLVGKPTQRVEHEGQQPTTIVVVHPGVGSHEAHRIDLDGSDVVEVTPELLPP